ncbi:MAG: hypothetical protein LBV47_00805 [Bacteroidales bacterium]|nr:hypothetical protein [Bacteroidales bacterium]
MKLFCNRRSAGCPAAAVRNNKNDDFASCRSSASTKNDDFTSCRSSASTKMITLLI